MAPRSRIWTVTVRNRGLVGQIYRWGEDMMAVSSIKRIETKRPVGETANPMLGICTLGSVDICGESRPLPWAASGASLKETLRGLQPVWSPARLGAVPGVLRMCVCPRPRSWSHTLGAYKSLPFGGTVQGWPTTRRLGFDLVLVHHNLGLPSINSSTHPRFTLSLPNTSVAGAARCGNSPQRAPHCRRSSCRRRRLRLRSGHYSCSSRKISFAVGTITQRA